MCKLKTKTEGEIAELFLSEAVMEDDERALVNKYGFCKEHYDLLYSGKNKLGVALQMSTRLNTVDKLIKPTSPKLAVKYARSLKEKFNDCVICRRLEFNMERYFQTVARLYGDDEKFRRQFATVRGFCYPDYIRLVENSPKAGKYASEFLEVLYNKQKQQAESLKKDLNDFTMAFDYRSSGLPPKNAQLSLVKSRIVFYGEKTTVPERK
jgi:hypothetical protein